MTDRITAEPKHIWLEPSDLSCSYTGQQWCEDDIESEDEDGAPVPWIKYVRADIADGLHAENDGLRDLLKSIYDDAPANMAEYLKLATEIRDLKAENERLRAAVKTAEETFRWYGDLHAAKPDMDKAYRNYELAQAMAQAQEPKP